MGGGVYGNQKGNDDEYGSDDGSEESKDEVFEPSDEEEPNVDVFGVGVDPYGESGNSNKGFLSQMQQHPEGMQRFVAGGLDGMNDDEDEHLPSINAGEATELRDISAS